tara:strand:+ start:1665 stop:2603 length:939 start_codon:yes stop_codon:yes gene_type:complete
MARKKLLSEGEVRQFMKLANLGPLSETYFTNNPLEEESEEEKKLHATEDELGAEDHLADEEGDELDVADDELALDGGGEGDNEELLARVVQAVADELGVEVDVEGAGEEGGEEDLEVDAELEEPLPGGEELEMGAEEEVELPGGRDMYQEKQGYDARLDDALGAKHGKKSQSEKDREHESEGEEEAEGHHKYAGDSKMSESLGPEAVEVAAQVAQMMGDPTAITAALSASPIVGALVQKLSDALADRKVQAAVASAGGEEEVSMDMDVAALNEDEIVAEVSRRVAARLQADKKRDDMASQLAERIFQRLTSK